MAVAYDGRERLITVAVNTESPDTLDVGAGNAGVRYTEQVPENPVPSVAHVAATGSNAATTVSVSGTQITVTLGTGATAGTVNATAAQVVTAIGASLAASAMVNAAAIGDGTGTAVAQAMTALSGGGTPIVDYVAVELQNSASLSSEREEIDTAHKGSGHATSITGQGTDSLSLECYDAKGTDRRGQARLDAAFNKGELLILREEEFIWDGNALVSQTPLQQNSGYMTSKSRDLNRNEAASFSAEFSLQEFWKPVAA